MPATKYRIEWTDAEGHRYHVTADDYQAANAMFEVFKAAKICKAEMVPVAQKPARRAK
jgi:hypothetical protein